MNPDCFANFKLRLYWYELKKRMVSGKNRTSEKFQNQIVRSFLADLKLLFIVSLSLSLFVRFFVNSFSHVYPACSLLIAACDKPKATSCSRVSRQTGTDASISVLDEERKRSHRVKRLGSRFAGDPPATDQSR